MSDTDVQDTIEYPQIIAFPDRGHSAIAWIDYFDETTYGADKLFFKKRCKTIQEVADEILTTAAIPHTKVPKGNVAGGIQFDFPIASINRYNVPDKKFLTFPDTLDPYPYKAKYAMRMLLRIKFYNDFGYMEIGIPWKPLYNEDGTLNELYPNAIKTKDEAGQEVIEEIDTTGSFDTVNGKQVLRYKVLNCTWMSKNDAEFLLENIGSFLGTTYSIDKAKANGGLTSIDGITPITDDKNNMVVGNASDDLVKDLSNSMAQANGILLVSEGENTYEEAQTVYTLSSGDDTTTIITDNTSLLFDKESQEK